MFRILIPIDFSDISLYGLQTAIDLNQKLNGEIIILNYVEPVQDKSFSATGDAYKKEDMEAQVFMTELIRKNNQRMEDIVAKYPDSNISYKVKVGNYSDAINDFISEERIDLVVMGTSGESTFTEFFVGNHTENIIRDANCPVLAVKNYTSSFNPGSMVLAVDLSTEGKVELVYIRELAQKLNMKVHFLHVVSSSSKVDEKHKTELEHLASGNGFSNYTVHLKADSNKEKAIQAVVNEAKADLLAVTTHARKGLSHLFSGSLSEDMVKQADVPVLVLTVNMEK
ncbi:MAG: universal stress protein [Candidatus Cyclobacteriaceae bacterium M3_2C_046]